MKRRDFLIRSAGAIGAMGPALAWAQKTPCPMKSIQVNSNPPVPMACPDANAAITQACAALSSGQSASFPLGVQSAFLTEDLEWQSAFYHDDQRNGFIHLLGKPANDNTDWKHQYFTTSTSSWTVVANPLNWNGPGHIYGNSAMDFVTGNVYQTSGDDSSTKKVHRWRKGSGWDSVPVNGAIYAGALNDHANGLAYHPNLYGPGDGGLVLENQFVTCFWRESTDASQAITHSDSTYGTREGMGLYWPAKNVVIIGGSDGNAGGSPVASRQLMIAPAPTPSGTPVATALGIPPILIGGHSTDRGATFGSMHVHPGNPNKLLLLTTAGPAAWSGTLSGSTLTWTSMGSHPFTDEPRVLCSLRGGMNCMWAVGTSTSVLWKPPA